MNQPSPLAIPRRCARGRAHSGDENRRADDGDSSRSPVSHPAAFSSFQPQQVVSKPKSKPGGDERSQKGHRHSFCCQRISSQIPEAVHPITWLRKIGPMAAAREKTVVGSLAQQERGEVPLGDEDDGEEYGGECQRKRPVSPPTCPVD